MWFVFGELLGVGGVASALFQAIFCFTAVGIRLITLIIGTVPGYYISITGYAARRTFVFWGMASNQSTLPAEGHCRTLAVRILAVVLFAMVLSSCSGQKTIGGIYLNHPDMSPGSSAAESFEINFQTYREGAAGGRTGSAGAGCGCQ